MSAFAPCLGKNLAGCAGPWDRWLCWWFGSSASCCWPANDVFRVGIPVALLTTLAAGYLLLLSGTFRAIISSIPQHWLIGIQTFRILGGLFLIRYFQGELPGVFAIPAGIGDVLTGLFAPLVAYWWVAGKPYARTAAIAWNLFGMADLVNAVVLGVLTGGGGGGIVFPIVLIPTYAVPRAFLVHSYSLIGLMPNLGPFSVSGIAALRERDSSDGIKRGRSVVETQP
jgi:hypothetical protein